MELRKGTAPPLRLIVIDPWEWIDDRFVAAEYHATLRRLVRMGAAAKVAMLVVVNCPGTPRANLTHQIQILESTGRNGTGCADGASPRSSGQAGCCLNLMLIREYRR